MNNNSLQQDFKQNSDVDKFDSDYQFEKGIYLYAKAKKRINSAIQPAWYGIISFVIFFILIIFCISISVIYVDNRIVFIGLLVGCLVLLILFHLINYVSNSTGFRRYIFLSDFKMLYMSYVWYLIAYGWIFPIVSFIGCILLIIKIKQLKNFYVENQQEIEAIKNPFEDKIALDYQQLKEIAKNN